MFFLRRLFMRFADGRFHEHVKSPRRDPVLSVERHAADERDAVGGYAHGRGESLAGHDRAIDGRRPSSGMLKNPIPPPKPVPPDGAVSTCGNELAPAAKIVEAFRPESRKRHEQVAQIVGANHRFGNAQRPLGDAATLPLCVGQEAK